MQIFEEEKDASQDESYEEFLHNLGLDHTEKLWDAFIEVWTAGYGWGLAEEYSFPS